MCGSFFRSKLCRAIDLLPSRKWIRAGAIWFSFVPKTRATSNYTRTTATTNNANRIYVKFKFPKRCRIFHVAFVVSSWNGRFACVDGARAHTKYGALAYTKLDSVEFIAVLRAKCHSKGEQTLRIASTAKIAPARTLVCVSAWVWCEPSFVVSEMVACVVHDGNFAENRKSWRIIDVLRTHNHTNAHCLSHKRHRI